MTLAVKIDQTISESIEARVLYYGQIPPCPPQTPAKPQSWGYPDPEPFMYKNAEECNAGVCP